MKKSVRVIAAALCLSILLSVAAFAGSSFAFTQEERDKTAADWDKIQSDDTVITLSVGAEPGEIGFSWLSGLFDGVPEFRYSESEDMKNAEKCEVTVRPTLWLKQSDKVTLSGLEEGRTYWYSYTEKGVWSEPQSFTVQPSDKYKIIFTSDAQIGRSGDFRDEDVLINDTCGWQRTVRLAAARYSDAAFIISAGDQTEKGYSLKQYKAFLSPEKLRNYPLVNVIGNHDFYFPSYTYYSNNPNQVKEHLAMPAGYGFYFVYGDALYIVMNSNDFNAADQDRLMRAAVTAYPEAKWRLAVLHHSVYSANISDDDFSFSRSVFAPLFDSYNIDLVLSGHEHLYNCTYPIYNGELDENGTVYLQASSASGSNFSTAKDSAVKYSRFILKENVATYTGIEFDGDEITINTYRTDTDELIDSASIHSRERKAESNPLKFFLSMVVSYIKTTISMF